MAVLWMLGGLTVYRAKVWRLTLTWIAAFAAFVAFAALRAAMIDGGHFLSEFAPIAAVECVVRLMAEWDVIRSDNPLAIAPPMFALFFVGPLAMVLQMVLNPPREQGR